MRFAMARRRRRSITNAHGSNSSNKDFAIGPVPVARLPARPATGTIRPAPTRPGSNRLSHRGISLLHLEEHARHRRGAQVAGQPGTRSRRGRASEYAVNLGGHDEVVLMQSLDLLGLQRDRRIAPTEADIRMMAFGFREFTNLLNKGKRLAEIAKTEAPLDAVSCLRQLPVRGLCVKELSLLAREWGYFPATGSAGFASKSFGHIACPSCQLSPAPRLANCETDVAIS